MRTQTKTASFPVPHGLPTGAQPRFTASTDDPDSERDRIRQDGLSHREPLPLLFAHGTRALPVGVVTGVHRHPHRTEMSFRWLERDVEAMRVKNAYEQGALSASIGFQVEDAVPNELGGYDIRKARVVEVSLVPVPANEHARALTKSLGAGGADEPVLFLADEDDDLVTVDPVVLAAAFAEVRRRSHTRGGVRRPDGDTVLVDEQDVRAAAASALAATVGREVRRALLRLTGRVD